MDTQTTTRHQMTASEATSFEGYSTANALILTEAAEARGCNCQPYVDFYTYDRWKAQGMQVQKGEHGVKIGTYIKRQYTDEATGEVKTSSRPWTTTVFCRCQVKPCSESRQSHEGTMPATRKESTKPMYTRTSTPGRTASRPASRPVAKQEPEPEVIEITPGEIGSIFSGWSDKFGK